MGKQMQASVIFLAFWMPLAATLAAQTPAEAPPASLLVLRDIPYYTGPGADPELNSMDLYLPEGKTNFPIVLFLHGGGLTRGDKLAQGFIAFAELFAQHGIAVASANYRLSPAVKHPAHIQDVARAFAWLYQNAAQYQADRGRIFLAGHSAGAYLAALLALHKEYLAAEGLSPQNIRGVMAISGTYDRLSSMGTGSPRRGGEEIMGTRDPALLRLASPAHLVGVDKQIPPFLITYTDHDNYGTGEQARRFYSLFLRHGLAAEPYVVTDRDHYNQIAGTGRAIPKPDEPGASMPNSVLADDTLGPALLRFVDRVLAGRPAANVLLKASAQPVRTLKDVAYSTGPGADPKLQSLDLYLPEGKTNFPVVFFIHGGGWRAGDKAGEGFQNFVTTFAKAGIGVASANYRLSPAVKHPAHMQDVAKAFAWLYENASQYQIDRNRLFVAGTSAGGHLAALLALDPQYLQKESLSPRAIKGVMGISGVYDIANFAEVGVIPSRREQAFEQAFENDARILEQASPVRLASAQAPPFLITYCENDLFSLREDAQNLYEAMLRKGAPVEMAHLPGRTHFDSVTGMGQQIAQVDDYLGPTAVQFVLRLLSASDGAMTQK